MSDTATTLYQLGVIGAGLLPQLAPAAQMAVIVAHRRLGGLPIPLAPSRLAEITQWAQGWLTAEAEAGRDVTAADVEAASAALATHLGGSDASPPGLPGGRQPS